MSTGGGRLILPCSRASTFPTSPATALRLQRPYPRRALVASRSTPPRTADPARQIPAASPTTPRKTSIASTPSKLHRAEPVRQRIASARPNRCGARRGTSRRGTAEAGDVPATLDEARAPTHLPSRRSNVGSSTRNPGHALQELAERRHTRVAFNCRAIEVQCRDPRARRISNSALGHSADTRASHSAVPEHVRRTCSTTPMRCCGSPVCAIGMRSVIRSPFASGIGADSTELYPPRTAAMLITSRSAPGATNWPSESVAACDDGGIRRRIDQHHRAAKRRAGRVVIQHASDDDLRRTSVGTKPSGHSEPAVAAARRIDVKPMVHLSCECPGPLSDCAVQSFVLLV